jgi:hypothetical protein
MRGLSDRLQRKMATCIDLTYGKDVSTALSVEAKYAGSGKNKGFGGERSNQGQAKSNGLFSGLLTRLLHVHHPSLSSSR